MKFCSTIIIRDAYVVRYHYIDYNSKVKVILKLESLAVAFNFASTLNFGKFGSFCQNLSVNIYEPKPRTPKCIEIGIILNRRIENQIRNNR
eukprot:UN15780